jgi:hypothetical protein
LGGLDTPGNSLADLGTRVTSLWENETHQLITDQQPADKMKLLLEFLERTTYVHLNMNVPELKKFSNNGFQTDSTGITIIAESINDFRRISILLYAPEIPVAIYIFDPAQSRPNLALSTSIIWKLNSKIEHEIKPWNLSAIYLSNLWIPALMVVVTML